MPLKTGGELESSGRVGCSCSTNDTRRVNLVTNPVISHEWEKDRELFQPTIYICTYPIQTLICILLILVEKMRCLVIGEDKIPHKTSMCMYSTSYIFSRKPKFYIHAATKYNFIFNLSWWSVLTYYKEWNQSTPETHAISISVRNGQVDDGCQICE